MEDFYKWKIINDYNYKVFKVILFFKFKCK